VEPHKRTTHSTRPDTRFDRRATAPNSVTWGVSQGVVGESEPRATGTPASSHSRVTITRRSPMVHPSWERMTASIWHRLLKRSASFSDPTIVPQCMGMATRGFILFAASAASSAVMV